MTQHEKSSPGLIFPLHALITPCLVNLTLSAIICLNF